MSNPLRIVSYLAIIIYLCAGVYFLVKPGALKGYSPNVQTGLGIVLLLYGLFRLGILIQRNRMLNKHKQQQNEN